MKVRRTIGHVSAACLLLAHAFALDPSRALTQYGHTAWRIQDGYFPSSPQAIAQTKDGQLWIGGDGGLLRFDGVQFSPWKPPEGQPLPNERVYGLLGASDGSLWIGTASGLARWKDGQLVTYAKAGAFFHIAEDSHGTIWAGHTRDLDLLPPLCRFRENDFKCFAVSDPPLPGSLAVLALAVDQQGDLWIGMFNGICRWHEARTECHAIPGSSALKEPMGVYALAVGSDNTVWVNGGATGIWQWKSGGWKHYNEFPQLKLQLSTPLLDGQGGLWLVGATHGVFRYSRGRVENFTRADGLSGDTITAIFQDREGSVWVGTSSGLDRFRDVKVATLTQREGLPEALLGSIASSRDGSLWIGGASKLIRLRMGEVASFEEVRGLPEKTELGNTFEDSRGRLWLGVGDVVKWLENGQFHQVPGLKLFPTFSTVRTIAEDIDGTIWVGTTDPQLALVHIGDGRVLERLTRQQLGQQITAMVGNPAGGVWLVRAVVPGLILARGGKFETVAKEFPSHVRNMFVDSDGVWAFASTGAALFRDGSVNVLSTKNGLPCNPRMGGIRDDSGALWLKNACGLMRISAPELALWMKHPSRQVQFRYFDAFDGVQAGNAIYRNVTKTSDGRLWFALEQGGIQVVDPNHLEDNPIPPPVAVSGLVADHQAYTLTRETRLPARTRDLEIDYTAYSFIVPEKMRFRYRLGGNDATWQDVGNRRQAYFSNLKPGRYRFEVSASNNDGVWNEAGAALDFFVAPAYYQTIWFRTLCVAAFLGLLFAFHRLQLHQVERLYNARLDERVHERTRIARELHDTMLQSFQGLVLKLYGVTRMLPDRPVEARETVEGLVEQAEQAVTEGRDAVQGLRSSTVITNDLARALTTLGQKLAAEQNGQSPVVFHLVVEGESRGLRPILRDEVHHIASEAIRNAFHHSGAARIDVEICYSERQFRLCVRDNGKGMDPGVLESGQRAGHYGLPGMQERATSVGGKLAIWSKLDSGTEAELTIPASRAYIKSRPSLRSNSSE